MVGPAVINIPPLSPLHLLLLLTDFLSRIQMQGLYYVVLCAVPSGVCQSHISEDNDVLSLAFSPLSSSPQALTRQKKRKREGTQAYLVVWAQANVEYLLQARSLSLFFPSSAAEGRALTAYIVFRLS